jgi:hypothetical protein
MTRIGWRALYTVGRMKPIASPGLAKRPEGIPTAGIAQCIVSKIAGQVKMRHDPVTWEDHCRTNKSAGDDPGKYTSAAAAVEVRLNITLMYFMFDNFTKMKLKNLPVLQGNY